LWDGATTRYSSSSLLGFCARKRRGSTARIRCFSRGKDLRKNLVTELPVKSHRINGSSVLARSHNPKAVGSNPTPVTGHLDCIGSYGVCDSSSAFSYESDCHWKGEAKPVFYGAMRAPRKFSALVNKDNFPENLFPPAEVLLTPLRIHRVSTLGVLIVFGGLSILYYQ
jgi:hypothetical protein